MVGVPGRSKGCNTCRRRKKGCDLQRPACGQCLKAGIECEGYERKRIFVNVTNPARGTTVRAAAPAAAPATTPSTAITHSLSRAAYEEKMVDLFWDGYIPGAPVGGGPANPISRYSHADWALTVQDLYRTEPALRQTLLAISLGTVGRRDGQQWMVDDGLRFYCRA
ncbi:C6 zinc finger domain-containing protein, partial [Colletotrichum musicola]